MIGFDYLGKAGQLGNQMFQYAATKGIAAHHGYEMCIPDHDEVHHDGIGNFLKIELDNPFTIHCQRGMIGGSVVQENGFHFNEDLFETCPDNVSLYGFFQSERYFKNIADEIREDYTFQDEYLEPCRAIMDEYKDQEPIMLHVRRGDPNLTDPRGFKWAYTQCSSMHPPQTIDYYERALAEFDDNQPVFVFSDSVDWVKEQEFFSGDRFLISEPVDKYADGSFTPYADLCLMSLCSHAIIANSSMSWWGAWLQANPNKKVIAPKNWFGPAYADKDTTDLYCPDWIIL